jgi:hypothetical protein
VKKYRLLATVLSAIVLIGCATAQSLGDAARQNRVQKKAAAQKVFTNDDLSSSAPLVRASMKEEEPAPAQQPTTATAQQATPAPTQQSTSTTEGQSGEATESQPEAGKPEPVQDAKEPVEAVGEKPIKAKAAADPTEWKNRVAAQKEKLSDGEKELNLMEREHQVRVAVYYADAGNQLRDSKKWFEDEKKYQDDHTAKQKEVEEARQKLNDIKEEARKAGVSMSALE